MDEQQKDFDLPEESGKVEEALQDPSDKGADMPLKDQDHAADGGMGDPSGTEEEGPHGPHPGEEARFSFTYQISKDQFYAYNEQQLRANAIQGNKRMRIMGIIEIAFFLLLGGNMLRQVSVGEAVNPLYWVLILVILGGGLFSILYYPYYYPKKLRKASDKLYDESSYLQNPITLQFYRDCMTEESRGEVHIADYETVSGFVSLAEFYFFALGDRRGVIMPKSVFQDDSQAESFFEYMNEVRDRHYLKYTRK